MKPGRHAKILELISTHNIETQDELLNLLSCEGYKATQATISRDIKELRLVKSLGADGNYRYASSDTALNDVRTGLGALLESSVVSMDTAQNIVVIKTCVVNGQSVEYGQELFLVDTAAE